MNGSENSSPDNNGFFNQFSNSEPITLFTDGLSTFNEYPARAFMILYPSPNAANRAALETRLGARYGLTVP